MARRRFQLCECPWICVLLMSAATAAGGQVTNSNPVLPGDHPDPSIIRVGHEYWATATTSEWAPIFPILHSRNLADWETVGAVFPKPPEWSAGSYWAPEIEFHNDRYFVYYTARKKGGPLCVAVATASEAKGPYTDHGPLVCQEDGSIDPMAIDDEKGDRFLVWKEDGNSRKKPTPIWAQRLSADGTALVEERKELFRNTQAWERQLVEGPFVLKRDGWFYLFYSGSGCCGLKCDYALGVARSRQLLGPWEKNPANPILSGNSAWRCPGHGSIVQDPDGRYFLLYHAYSSRGSVYVGRQGLLDEVTFGANGWPTINGGKGPGGTISHTAERTINDDFSSSHLQPTWQWPWNDGPGWQLQPGNGGWVILEVPYTPAKQGPQETILAQPSLSPDYTATILVDLSSVSMGTQAGLSAYGNRRNALGISAGDGKVMVWLRRNGEQKTVASQDFVASRVYLRMTAKEGGQFSFSYSDNGHEWRDFPGELQGAHLPPWDLAVRIALTCSGPAGGKGRFAFLRVVNAEP